MLGLTDGERTLYPDTLTREERLSGITLEHKRDYYDQLLVALELGKTTTAYRLFLGWFDFVDRARGVVPEDSPPEPNLAA